MANATLINKQGNKQAPTSNVPVTSNNPDAPKMVTGYDASGKAVQVPKGAYVPGVSLTPKKLTPDSFDVTKDVKYQELLKKNEELLKSQQPSEQVTAAETAATNDAYSKSLNDLKTQIQGTLTETFTPEQQRQNQSDLLNTQETAAKLKANTQEQVDLLGTQPIEGGFITRQQAKVQSQYEKQAGLLSAEETKLVNEVNLSNTEKQNLINGSTTIANLQDKIQTHIDSAKADILAQAKQLTADQQAKLATALDAYKGIDVDKLTAEQTATFSKIITDAGLDPQLVFQGIKAVNQQQALDNSIKQAGVDTGNWAVDATTGKLYNKKTGEFKDGTTVSDVNIGTVTIPTTSRIASTNNNPGNLIYVGQDGAEQGEAKLDTNGNPTGAYWAKFSTPEAGFQALVNDITGKMTGNTTTGLTGDSSLQDLVSIYAPAGDNNNPVGYAATLAKNLGVSTDTKLNDLLPRVNDVSKFIANIESGAKIADQSPKQLQDSETLNNLDVSDKATWLNASSDDKNIARGLANYTLDITKVSSLRGNKRTQLANLAMLINPSFDINKYAQIAKTKASFAGGGVEYKNMKSLNTAVNHLQELSKASEALNNKSNTWWNSFANKAASVTGSPIVTNFNTAANAVAGEMATIFKNTSGTDQEIKAWKDQISSSSSPEQLKGSINTMLELMAGRLKASRDTYTSVTGIEPDFNIITGSARDILKNLGMDIDSIDPLVDVSNITEAQPSSADDAYVKSLNLK